MMKKTFVVPQVHNGNQFVRIRVGGGRIGRGPPYFRPIFVIFGAASRNLDSRPPFSQILDPPLVTDVRIETGAIHIALQYLYSYNGII